MRRFIVGIFLLFGLTACGAEPIWAPDEQVQSAIYRHPGPKSLSLITVINNRSGAGGHTALVINGSQRVIWDPAGTWWNPKAPERNDLHYGATDRMIQTYIDYHTRETYHTVVHEIDVSAEVAEKALQLAASKGPIPKSACSISTSEILSQLPGFQSVPKSYFPKKIMDAFSALPGVTSEKFFDDDPDDNSDKLAAF